MSRWLCILCDRRKELSLVYRIDIHDIEDNDDSDHTHDEEQGVSNQFSALLGIQILILEHF